MLDLLSKLSGLAHNKIVEPQEIFISLPSKAGKYKSPYYGQETVWNKWFKQRNDKIILLK
ncbi:MAG: hypothetical protein LBU73_04355 [Helicobacteraceae bacterium]|jgi:hypothetical protein|nr:hypothetical protein [Helicobacteraceae bacterium]